MSTLAYSCEAASAPTVPAPHLRPALVNDRRVLVECPSWCTMDHVAENERHLEDIEHAGELSAIVIPGGEPGYRLLAHIRLSADLFATDPADRLPVVVVDDGSEGFRLTPPQARQYAARLIAHAEQVQMLAQQAAT